MIDGPSALADLIARARKAEAVGLDTEFVWERTYYPRLGVVQLSLAEDDVHLLDAPALGDLSALGELLADASVVKVLHDAQQDLTLLARATGALPRNVFDTQRAGGFVGLLSTLSLQALVNELVGVHLPKEETRTDWLRRPLSAKQLAYAEEDVRYLPRMRRLLLDAAESRGRRAWVEEEMARYDDPALYNEAPVEEALSRVKVPGFNRLSGRQRAVLRELAIWREAEARRADLPRRFVLPDEALGDLARVGADDLQRLAPLTPKQRERYGRAILTAGERGRTLPPEAWPRSPDRSEDEDVVAARTLVAQALVAGRAASEGLDPALVAPKAEVRALVEAGPAADPERHPLLRGWRRQFVGEDLLRLLGGDAAVALDPDAGWPRLA